MSITHDLLLREYALTGNEEKIISYLTLNSDVTPRTCPNVLYSFTLKGDMVSHKNFIVSQQTLVYTRPNEEPWEK